jgi:DNA-binding PadR family transcriptional regulator
MGRHREQPPRRYYRITPIGRKRLQAAKMSFDFLLAGIARIMEA